MRIIVHALWLAALGGGCAPQLNVDDYDRSCGTADDCVAVVVGDVCGGSCGPGPDAAINRSDEPKLEADAEAAQAWCAPTFAVCLLGGPSVAITCTDGVCGIEQVPEERAPEWSWKSPIAATTIPTNARFTGDAVAGSDPAVALVATLTVDGESAPRVVPFTTAHCALTGGCETVLDPGPMPANTHVSLAFTPHTRGTDGEWTTTDGPDTSAPVVTPLVLQSQTPVGDGHGHVSMSIEFKSDIPTDDNGVAAFGAFRSLDGAEPVLLERLNNLGEGVVDQVRDDSGAKQACYSFAAWDWAGNESRAAPVCVDVTVSKKDHDTLAAPGCSSAGTAPAALVGVALVLARRRRRDPTARSRTRRVTSVDRSSPSA
jgi:MYXO-CTERM domain-containing protein